MRRGAWIFCVASAILPAQARDGDDDPPEYRGRTEHREAYRKGYERGYDRGFQRGLEEAQKRAPPPPPVAGGPILVTRATYGSSRKSCDATRWVMRRAEGKRTFSLKVTNDMCGDPDFGQRKTLEVSYRCGGLVKTASARETQSVYLDCTS